ncbi:trypsin I-P1-like [Siphateles boraxobius]|uniref:trypsin I-P1-like n=1 Tax=Siphateles boraxobius TaxID=180520 RepID=UPI004062E0F0
MKSNIALSVAGITLLYIAGSLCQLDVCGRAPLNTRIVGGGNATAGTWPWQVSIHVTGIGHTCGGTLITKDWVLSAAHCFHEVIESSIVMYFGRLDQSGSNPNEVCRTAREIIRHRGYVYPNPDNDIALVRLSSFVIFTDYIKPVCLAAAGSVFSAGTESWVTGWGRLQCGGLIPEKLQEVMIPILNNSECNNTYGVINTSITNNMICAGFLNQGGKGSCKGDSGGPIVSKIGSLWIESGIMSFCNGCVDPKYPGVYTRVSQYQDWIKSQMSSNPPGFVEFNVEKPTSTEKPTCIEKLTCTEKPTSTEKPTCIEKLTCTEKPTSNSYLGSVLNLLLFSLSLTFFIIPFFFSVYLAS